MKPPVILKTLLKIFLVISLVVFIVSSCDDDYSMPDSKPDPKLLRQLGCLDQVDPGSYYMRFCIYEYKGDTLLISYTRNSIHSTCLTCK